MLAKSPLKTTIVREGEARYLQHSMTGFAIPGAELRVIGADGTLTGYAGGLARKATLLRLEGVPTEDDPGSLF